MAQCFATRLFDRVKLELFGVRNINTLGSRHAHRVVTQCIRFSVTTKPHQSASKNNSSRELLNVTLKVAALVKKYTDERNSLGSLQTSGRAMRGDINSYISENIAAVIRDKSTRTFADCWKTINPKKIAVYSKRFSDRTEVYIEVARYTFSPTGEKSHTCVVLLGVQCADDLTIQSDIICIDEREYATVLAKQGAFGDIKNLHRIFNHRIGKGGTFTGKRIFSKQITLIHPGYRTNGQYSLGLAELCMKAICWNLPLSQSLVVESCLVDRIEDLVVEFDDILAPVLRDILVSGPNPGDGLASLCEHVSAVEMSPIYCEIIHILYVSCSLNNAENHRDLARDICNFMTETVQKDTEPNNNLGLLIKDARKNEPAPIMLNGDPDNENSLSFVAVCSFVAVASKKSYGYNTQAIRSEVNRLINNGANPLNQTQNDARDDFVIASPSSEPQQDAPFFCATWSFLPSESDEDDTADDVHSIEPAFDPIEEENRESLFRLWNEIQSADAGSPCQKRPKLSEAED